MTTVQVVLEFLRVLLSAPPVAGLVLLTFLLVFRKDIRALMGRIATIRFPGGELSISQSDRAAEVAASKSEASVAETTSDPGSQLPNFSLTPEDQQRLIEFFQAERARAALWEYRYLNFYLVPHTQRVLDWLVSLPQRTTFQMYDSFWLPMIPDPGERRVVIEVLRAHHLVQIQGDMIEVTPKGREYVQWRGPLPQLPAP